MKKAISILLALITALSVFLCGVSSASAASVLGDVGGDGEVDITDATLIQRHLIGMIALGEDAQERGRVSGGDELTIVDATLIQRYLVKMISRFPVEEPTKVKNDITIRFTDNKKWDTVYAYLYNKATGEAFCEWPGVQMTEDGSDSSGKPVLSALVDVSRYDRVIFNNGDAKQTTETPVTKASAGYTLKSRVGKKYYAEIYTCGNTGMGTFKTVKMDYPVIREGEKRNVYIWLPEGYNAADTGKRYSVLYMCDGQNLFGNVENMSGAFWKCQESVASLMENGGDGVLIVGIDNDSMDRYSELTTDIGEFNRKLYELLPPDERDNMQFRGEAFSDFVVNDVIPYIESNYNVNSVRGIAGASCGGQEAFCTGMKYPETFSYVGAFSSTFEYFEEEAWDEYLSEKDFSGNVPRIYFYTGLNEVEEDEVWMYPLITGMESRLADLGYPTDKMVNITDEDARHHEDFWSLYFPEMLCWGLEL